MWLTPIFNPIDIQLKCAKIIYNWFLPIKCVKTLYVYMANHLQLVSQLKYENLGSF
jgi:hypothetical protein